MGVRIAELPSSKGISKTDLIIVQDNEATKQGTIQQLDDSLGVSRLKEEFEALGLSVDEEETEEMNHVQDFE